MGCGLKRSTLITIAQFSAPILVPVCYGLVIGVTPNQYLKDRGLLISGFIVAYLASSIRFFMSLGIEKRLRGSQYKLGQLVEKIRTASKVLKGRAEQLPSLIAGSDRSDVRHIKDTSRAMLEACYDLEKTANSLDSSLNEGGDQ